MTTEFMLKASLIAILYNAFVFGIYGWDKRAARNGQRRVRESTLLWLAIAGGGPGALLAQRLLRHKTRKAPFEFGLPMIFFLQVVALTAILIFSPIGSV